jgi:hypothetical protein
MNSTNADNFESEILLIAIAKNYSLSLKSFFVFYSAQLEIFSVLVSEKAGSGWKILTPRRK